VAIAQPDHDVLIIGGGFSGIGVAIGLEKAGIRDYLIVDDNDGFGGTWRWNTYPGIAVDIPSFSYQFSFEKRADWSRTYALGTELRAYAEDCAHRHGLPAKARFGVRVTGAAFDEDAHAWTLTTRDGEEIVARHVIDATGVLTHPKMPDIPGVGTFEGTTVHTARWDHSLDLRGKRVAVIGTGASAVQVIPAIVDEVEHLTVFQRTPVWCMPKFDRPIPPVVTRALRRVPGVQAVARLVSQSLVEVTFTLAAHYHRGFPLTSAVERMARNYLAQEVHDPVLRDKLTPRYAVGCKRPTFHNEYLATFNRDDVALETTPIERIAESGIVTENGTEHPIDVLVLATGFKVFDAGNMPAYPVSGREGLDLQTFWDENRHQAYEGISVPGFPNYFTMFGPLRIQRLVLLQPRRDPGPPHRALPEPRARSRRHSRRGLARGQRPLLRRDAPPPRSPGLLAGELRARQQLLLRQARRRAAAAGHDARDDLARPTASTSATTASPPPSASRLSRARPAERDEGRRVPERRARRRRAARADPGAWAGPSDRCRAAASAGPTSTPAMDSTPGPSWPSRRGTRASAGRPSRWCSATSSPVRWPSTARDAPARCPRGRRSSLCLSSAARRGSTRWASRLTRPGPTPSSCSPRSRSCCPCPTASRQTSPR
jgi:cation diffusion facilitator CzcD-associated flavoprotein CzcO